MSKSSAVRELQTPENWGVKCRARTSEDFRGVIWPAVLTTMFAVTAWLFISTDVLTGMSVGFADLLKAVSCVVAVAFAVLTLVRFSRGWTAAGNEAAFEAIKKFQAWQEDVLAPYLEAKHGVKIQRQRNQWWMMEWFTVTHPTRGTMQVRVEGIDWDEYFSPELPCSEEVGYSVPPIPRIHQEPWLEEVIRPAKISYRKLEEIAR